jgi:hypothetical protein
VAASLAVENESDRLGDTKHITSADGRNLRHRSGDDDVERLDEDVFDWQRFAMGLEAFKLIGDGLSDVGGGVIVCAAFGMTSGQRGTEGVVSAIGLRLDNYRVSHARSIPHSRFVRSCTNARPLHPPTPSWMIAST